MELVHTRIQHLYSLWNNLGYYGTDPTDQKSSIPSWMEEKLQPTLRELDKLATYEAKQCTILRAEVEDLELAIEERCHSLGRKVDIYLPRCTPINTNSLYATYLELKRLCSSLDSELSNQKRIYEASMATLQMLSQELFETEKLPNPDPGDFSRGTVDSLVFAAENLTKLKKMRIYNFDRAATTLFEAWQCIKFVPTDEVEQALVDRFAAARKECLDNMPNLTTAKLTWYSPNQPPLTLSGKCVESMLQKQARYGLIMRERKERYTTLLKKIDRLYMELEIPASRRKLFDKNYEETTLFRMENEHERLRGILMVNLDQLIDDYKHRLAEYWEKCEVSQDQQSLTMLRIMKGADKVERADILREELIQLEELYSKCHLIFSAMQERRELIHKMVEFEKTASDPRRLFRSSFQLNQEEKWRKTAYPNLLKFEEELINAILDYELQENKPFVHNHQRYMDVLEKEISERSVNLTVFGFGNGSPIKGRIASYSGLCSTRNLTSHGGRPSSPLHTPVTPLRHISRNPTRSVSRTGNIDDCRSSVSSNDSVDSVHTPLPVSNLEDSSYRSISASYSNTVFEPQTPRTRSKSRNTSTLPRYRNSPSPPLHSLASFRSNATTFQKPTRKPAVAVMFGDTVNSSQSPIIHRIGTPRNKNASSPSKYR